MADPFSIVASIIGVAVASAQLANKVHDFTDKVKNAPTQMHDIASEMSHLSSIFNLLATVLEEGSGAYKPQVLTDAESILRRVKKIQEEIRRLMKKNSGTYGIRTRLKWVLSSGKVAELLDRIEALKSSLSILLDTTQLAVACREPRSSSMEIERLKQVITAGVKEIRQCVIGLQTAKPALMFEPPKLLTEGTSADVPVSRAYPWLPIVPASTSFSKGIPKGRTDMTTAEDTINAIEPSSSQFETASWLYSMTLANAEIPEGDSIVVEEHWKDPLPKKSSNDIEVVSFMGSPRAISPSRRDSYHAHPMHMQITKVPPPQQLYDLSISAIVQRLVKTWTFLDPVETLPEMDAADGEDLDAPSEMDSADDAEDRDPSPPEPPRRRFTFQEYDHALESGNIHDASFQPQRSETQRFGRGTSRYLNPEVHYNNGLPRDDSRNRSPPPNISIYNTTRMEDDRDPDIRTQRARRRSNPGPARNASNVPRRVGEWTLDDEIERLRLQVTRERLKAAEASLEAEKREEKAGRRDGMMERKLDRLENLMITQQEAQVVKDKAEKQAQTEAAAKATEAKKQADEDKLARLEKLILDQKEEQLQREAKTAAAQASERDARDTMARKIADAEAAAAEMAAEVQRAAKQAREEAEARAARELAHERELRRQAEEMAFVPPPSSHSESNSDTVVSDKVFLAASGLVEMIYGKEPESRWYQTASGPRLIDTSDGYFARRILHDMNSTRQPTLQAYSIVSLENGQTVEEQEPVCEALDTGSSNTSDQSTRPGKPHLVFPTSTRSSPLECTKMIADLKDGGMESLFEIDAGEGQSKMLRMGDVLVKVSVDKIWDDLVEDLLVRSAGDTFIDASLLWQKLPRNGQSELYRSLCKTGWKPTYVRTSERGQTWFYGERPVHVRFSRPDYVPRVADFENDTFHDYVMVGTDIVDEDALRLTGIEYQLLRSGCWRLEPTITYEDIEALIATSFSLREMTLRRMARKAVNDGATRLNSSNNKTVSTMPDIPALQAFSHGSEPSLGAQEDVQDDSANST